MPVKALNRIALIIFLCAGLAGWFWHALKPPYDAVAQPRVAPPLTFQGGSGDTPTTAVVIANAPDYVAVVAGEYQYLEKQFGKRGQDWRMVKKEVCQHEDKVYDLITIEFPKGAKQQIFFEITKYFKKP
jgi:hypothetical protein